MDELEIVVFNFQQEEFCISMKKVKEIIFLLQLTPLPEAPKFVAGIIQLRGQPVIILNLANKFDLPHPNQYSKAARIAILEMGGIKLGIIVDQVPEMLRINEKDIEPISNIIHTKIKLEYLMGIIKINHRLIVMIELDKLISVEELKILQEINKKLVK